MMLWWNKQIIIRVMKNVMEYLNPFVPNAPFMYPLKTSENRKGYWCLQGVQKGCIGNKWVECESMLRSILAYIFSALKICKIE